MAITAWSAKVSSSLICLSEKGRTSAAADKNHPDGNTLAQQGCSQGASGTTNLLNMLVSRKFGFDHYRQVVDVNGFPVDNSPATDPVTIYCLFRSD